MGDGGCAVLSSRHALVEFHNSDSCHREQVRGRCDWVPELVAVVGFAPNCDRIPAVSDDDKNRSWAAVGICDMEPCSSSQCGEAGDEANRRKRRLPSRWDNVIDKPSSSSERQKDDNEGPARERRAGFEQGAGPAASNHGCSQEQRQRAGIGEESGKRLGDSDQSWSRGHFNSGWDVGGDVKDRNVDDWGCQQTAGKSTWRAKENADSRNQHYRTSGRDNHDTATGGDAMLNFEAPQRNKQETGRAIPAIERSGNGHFPPSREVMEKDNGSKFLAREHDTGNCHHTSDREAKEKKGCDWNDHDSIHSSVRGAWRVKENGVSSNHYSAASEGHLGKDELRYRHAERDSQSGRRHHNTRERSYESGSSSGHVETSSHRSNTDRYTGRNSFPDKGGYSSYGRDYHGRSWNVADKNVSQRNGSDRASGRSHSRRYDDRYGKEHRHWSGHTKDRRLSRNWEEKPAENKGNHLQDSAAGPHCSSDTAYRDESRSVEMDIPMDLSPAPVTAEDGAGRSSEISWSGACHSGGNDHTVFGPACIDQESKCRGWIYIDSEGNTEGPMELPLLKKLLEDGKLQSDHMVRINGSNEWVTLEHAGSPSSGYPSTDCTLAGPPATSSEPVQAQLHSDHPFHQQCLPSVSVENAVTVEDIDECAKHKCIPMLEQQLPKDDGSMIEIEVRVNERVEQLMQGFDLVPGKEKEVILEALNHAARRAHQENELELENEESPQPHVGLAAHWKEDQLIGDGHGFGSLGLDSQASKEPAAMSGHINDMILDRPCANSFQSARKWTSRGGDWKLVCQPEITPTTKGQANFDRFSKAKVVLNAGIPLCEGRHSGSVDPRRDPQESFGSEVSTWRTLELPPWAYRLHEVKSENIEPTFENLLHTYQPLSGTPVLMPKAQVSTHVSQLSTPRGGAQSEGQKKIKTGKFNTVVEPKVEQISGGPMGSKASQLSKCDSRVAPRNLALANKYVQVPSSELELSTEQPEKIQSFGDSSSELVTREIASSDSLQMSHEISFPLVDKASSHFVKAVPQLARKEDLRLQEGDWYYRDGAGHEIGPFSYARLQLKVKGGSIYDGVIVYRKSDDTWVPISAVTSSCHSLIPLATQESQVLAGHHRGTSDLKVNKLVCAATLEPQSGALGRAHDGHTQADPMPVSSDPMALDHESKEEPAIPGREESMDFHQLHPQFMGYMSGKLHEHVMKSYRSRDFAAMLLEGLEKWFSDKQSRSAAETSMVASFPSVSATGVPEGVVPVPSQNSSSLSSTGPFDGRDGDKYDSKQRESEISDPMSSAVITSSCFSTDECEQSFQPTIQVMAANDPDHPKNRRVGKRRRLLDIQDGHAGKQPPQIALPSDFKPSVLSPEMGSLDTEVWAKGEVHKKSKGTVTQHNWGTMESHLLMTVFSFLEVDLKSLVFASATCKSWRVTFDKFKKEVRQIDLSSLGNLCSDAVLYSFTGQAPELSKIILRGCTELSVPAVRSFLLAHPSITTVDVNGSDQLKELVRMFSHIQWVGSPFATRYQQGPQESPCKIKSLKLIGERKAPAMKAVEGLDAHSSDDSICKDRTINLEVFHAEGTTEPMDLDPSHCQDRDSETSHIARSNLFVKRTTLNNGGKFMKIRAENSHRKVVLREYAIVGSHTRYKEQVAIHERKPKQKSMLHLANAVNAYRSSADRSASLILKGDSLLGAERDKNLEKDMADILKTVKEADTNKFFFHQVADSKGTSYVAGRALAFPVIEEKLRGGGYLGSKDGLMAFKNDLFLLCRSAFQVSEKGSQIFKAGEDIFKLAFRLVTQLEKSLSIASPSRDGSLSKSFKRKYHNLQSGSTLVGRKREIGDDIGKERVGKRRRGLEESSADDESEGNFSEREGRRFYNKKKHWREWETDASGTDEEDENLFQDEKEEDTDESELEIESESEGEGEVPGGEEDSSEDEAYNQDWSSRVWGARMTKASMVPPATRKYELIEEYVVVADEVEVNKRMGVNLPEDFDEKLRAAREKRGAEYSHLEIPDLKEYKPRKQVGSEVLEQEVYGIDPYTHNLLMDSMPNDRSDFSDARRHQLIEEDLLKALNQEARRFTGSGKAPMKYPLEPVVQSLVDQSRDSPMRSFCLALLRNIQSRTKDKYVAYRKGLGVVCNHEAGFEKDDFVVEFFGEVYPAWRWFEKQDAIRSLQKKDKDPAPEFYNIFLERPKGDASGYDLVVVDAMHKANYASRICHSCRPNCEAKVTAVDGRYQIGVYTLRPVQYGEELTFDYNSVTESKEEHEASVCLCGSQGCRGSYLNLAGPETFQEVMRDCHGLLHRHDLLLEACVAGPASKKDWDDLKQAGLGDCLLQGLPDWTIGYAARVVRFMNNERKCLPKEILKGIMKERRLHTCGDSEILEAEVQADGVFNSRLQNLAITLDKVRYVFKKLFGDPKSAPPPLRKLEPAELVSLIWKHENSVVAELLRGMAYHGSKDELLDFKRKVREHDPVESGNVEKNLRQSLLWLRDELCKAPAACLSRHDAAADIIHMYAHTRLFFTSQDYTPFDSPPLSINSLDLGPKHAHTLGAASQEWSKTYNKDYVLGQLIFWYKHNVADPGSSLAKARRGCLVLPDLLSCYAKSAHQNPRLRYGERHRVEMFRRMEHRPQKQWSKQDLWEFKNNRGLFGSPMMDAIRQKNAVNKEIMYWLKNRPVVFEGPWDKQ